MRLNIIVGNRAERFPRLMDELQAQGIDNFDLWDGVFLKTAKEGINRAHKQVIEYAKVAGWSEVCVAEDDLRFTRPGAWEYFLRNKPEDFDIYLSGIYVGDIGEDKTVKNFSGFHLYVVHERFYDRFLSTPNDEHIDRALSGLGIFKVCYPFAAIQYEGFSSNTGKDEVYHHLLQGRELY